MIKQVKPNHTCRNQNCHKGDDGGRKMYYACNSCVRGKPSFWQEFCCSLECYQEYMAQLDAHRSAETKETTVEKPVVIEEKKEPEVVKAEPVIEKENKSVEVSVAPITEEKAEVTTVTNNFSNHASKKNKKKWNPYLGN